MEYQALHTIPWQHGSFWVAVAIVIFAVLFAGKIARPVAAMLDARTAGVRAALDQAARLKAEAEAMLEDAKLRAARAERDARNIMDAARDEAARVGAELAREAEAAARWRERLAMERIAAAEKAAVTEVRAAAIDIATAAAAHVLGETFGAKADGVLVDHAIAGAPAALREVV
jgi:F-type H+-transporting ATPase subunit b